MVDPPLSIGAFAHRSRLSPKALRLYERLGLLRPAEVDEATGYRRYRQSQLARARLVALLRQLDMPLARIAEVVAAPAPAAAELIGSYWDAVERRSASQRELAIHLQIKLLGDEGSYLRMFDIQERDVPEQLVLTEQRHIHIQDMPTWQRGAIARLSQVAQTYGGMAGPLFVIFHGEVNEDSDGPLEVCVPISLAHATTAEVPTRREPAHREVYVRVTKAQFDYPQILSAYDALGSWISSHNGVVVGAPREIRLADLTTAAPTDEVCDVAFPLQLDRPTPTER